MPSRDLEAPKTIPVVDISAFIDDNATPQAKEDVVEAVSHACTTYGFFYLVGHGIPEADREQILDCARLFASLPLDEKMDISVSKCMGQSFRGYEPPALQLHQKGLLPDTKEAFIFGREVSADHPDAGRFSTGPNQWPPSLPDSAFRDPLLKYQEKMVQLVSTILKILARGLPEEWNCPPDVFDAATVEPSIPMRLLHYAPQSEENKNQFGVGDHTDFGNVSVLLQEEGTVGLEVWYPPTETWIPVPVIPGSYVINMGDMMQKWTAGHYRSARHRVVNHNKKPRFSAPFFLNGNIDLKCRALDGSGVETVIGEHIRQRLFETIGGDAGKKLGKLETKGQVQVGVN